MKVQNTVHRIQEITVELSYSICSYLPNIYYLFTYEPPLIFTQSDYAPLLKEYEISIYVAKQTLSDSDSSLKRHKSWS